MKKVFISQPMNGLSDLQIEKDRARVIEGLYNEGYKPDEIMVIDTFIEENAPDNVNSGLWYLGKSLELLAKADIAVFAKGWRNARGCQIEFKCAKEYGISYICEEEEAFTKADVVTILKDFRLDIQEAELAGVLDNKELIFADEVDDLVQQKINTLRELKDEIQDK